jgi:hypothetical protein
MIEEFKNTEHVPDLTYFCPVIVDGEVQKCYNKLGQEILKDSEGWNEVLSFLEDNALIPADSQSEE